MRFNIKPILNIGVKDEFDLDTIRVYHQVNGIISLFSIVAFVASITAFLQDTTFSIVVLNALFEFVYLLKIFFVMEVKIQEAKRFVIYSFVIYYITIKPINRESIKLEFNSFL